MWPVIIEKSRMCGHMGILGRTPENLPIQLCTYLFTIQPDVHPAAAIDKAFWGLMKPNGKAERRTWVEGKGGRGTIHSGQ